MRKNRHTTYCVVEGAVCKANSMDAAFAFPQIIEELVRTERLW